MPSKNIILNSLKESFILLWRNKSLFALLFILQIVFFVIFLMINFTYQTKILESAKTITEYLSQQRFDDVSVASNILQQKSLLGDDPLLISREFDEILSNFKIYLAFIFILMIFFPSINWTLTYNIKHKSNFNKLINDFLKILIIAIFYLGLIFTFFYSLTTISLTGVAFESTKLLTKYVPFLIFSVILLYFMYISISLAKGTELKDIVQKTLKIGIKKIHYILAIYFINIFLFVVSISLFYIFLEKNFFILLLSIALAMFSLIFGRIFVVNFVEKLE